ncbi:hypothetical protein LCGC14_2492410 [marine sediment metagenome]|uniref:Macro domain-containing protein n=1 Tax=marine sediment metagenome TaxID=412755 RepID=A0A0F9BSC1_9ZZZZ
MLTNRGNIWTYPAEVVLITTNGIVKKNGEAVMGRGCAREARDYFPGISLKLAEYLTQYGNRPFNLGHWDYPKLSTIQKWIWTFPTKHNWRDNSDLDLITASARHLIQMANKFEVTTIVLPRPGCANGKLSWEVVQPIIADIFDDRFTSITF